MNQRRWTKERKGKEEHLYSALKALRHGSHSFTGKHTMPAFEVAIGAIKSRLEKMGFKMFLESIAGLRRTKIEGREFQTVAAAV